MELLLGTTALSGGLSFLSGLGQQKSVKKQNRVQMWLDQQNNIINAERMESVNAQREALGRELLTIEEKTREVVEDTRRVQRTQWGDVDVAGFMAAGEKAGFNPVTWLNSGALSLFARQYEDTQNSGSLITTTTRTGHNAADAFKLMAPDMVSSQSTQVQREPSMMEVIGNAGTAALNTFNSGYKTLQSQDFQTQLLEKQLAAIAGRSGIRVGRNAASGTAGSVSSGGGATSVNAGLSLGQTGANWNKDPLVTTGIPYPSKWESNDVKVTNPGFGWKVMPRWSDAQGWGDAYSDIGENIYGAIRMANDAFYNVTGQGAVEGTANLWSGKTWNGQTVDVTKSPLLSYLDKLAKRGLADPYWTQR